MTFTFPKSVGYRFSWQPDSFYVEDFLYEDGSIPELAKSFGPGKMSNFHFFSGHYAETSWYCRPYDQLTYCYGPKPTERNGLWVRNLAVQREMIVLQAVHLGLNYVIPGSIAWTGGSFKARFSDRGLMVEGGFTGSQSDKREILEYRVDQIPGTYRVEYDMSEGIVSGPRRVPSSFRRIYASDSGGQPIVEAILRIKSMRIADNTLSNSHFALDKQLEPHVTRVYTLTDEGMSYIGADRKLTFVKPSGSVPPPPVSKGTYKARRVFWVCFATLNLAGFFLLYLWYSKRMPRSH